MAYTLKKIRRYIVVGKFSTIWGMWLYSIYQIPQELNHVQMNFMADSSKISYSFEKNGYI
jgi:hypothetical protein